jgi:hypothetical protein
MTELEQSNGVMDFIVTYGWAIVVVIVIIGGLAFFGILSPERFIKEEKNETYQEKVCSNLDKDGSVYKEIPASMQAVEQTAKMKVVDVWANTSKPKMWNNDGVMCEIDAQACQPQYVFCMDIKLIVPVNYTEYEAWYNG